MTSRPSPFMRLHEVIERVRLSRWTLWRMVNEGLFPPPVRVSRGRTYYLAADVDHWIATRRPDPGFVTEPRATTARSAAPSAAPARARSTPPSVHELLLRSGRSPRFARQAAAAATRRRLFGVAPPPATPAPHHASARKRLPD